MGKCYSCVRYLMFFFNVLFLLMGMGVVALGIWMRLDQSFFEKYLTDYDTQMDDLHTLAYVVIVIGSVIMVTSFLGCCGAIAENRVMLVIFFILLLVVAIVFLLSGALFSTTFSGMPSIRTLVRKSLENGVDEYFTENSFGREYMDRVQNDFECCGASLGILDYPLDKGVFVKACQKYTEPCVDSVVGYINGYIVGFIVTLFVIGSLAVLGMVFSCILCCSIKNRE